MTKKFFLYLFCLASLSRAQTPTVTGVTYDSLSHSVIRIDFSTSAGWRQGHIRYIDTTVNPGGVCTDGASGVVQPTGYNGNAGPTYGYYQMMVGGLTPGHTYSFCPEVNGSTGAAYSSGGPSVTVTMPPIPAIHPALPVPPATFPTGYAADVGTGATLTLGTDCANLTACLVIAINNQLTQATTISVPAGVPASSIGGVGPFLEGGALPVSPDVVNFNGSTQVNSGSTIVCSNTTPNSICLTNHGFSENQQAVFGVNYGCLPGDQAAAGGAGFPGCNSGGNNNAYQIPFPRGIPLTIHVLDANTFQVYLCPLTNRTCTVSQGTPITFGDQGGTSLRYAKFPRALHSITVRTSTPDSQFVPLGSLLEGAPDGTGVPTRPTQWLAKMGNLQLPIGNINPLITLGDGNFDPMRANIRFVGLHFSYTDTSEPAVSGDPTNGGAFFNTDLNTSGIVWDRCYFDAPGTPFRTGIVFAWNGMNTGFFGNYVTGMEAWNQTVSGLGIGGSGHTVTIGSGSTRFGAGTGTLANNATITLGGSSANGQQRLFLDFSLAGTLNVVAPPGITTAVSGVSNYHVTSLQGFGAGSGPAVLNVNSSSLAIPTGGGINNYYVDPVVSSSSNCSNTTSLFSALSAYPAPNYGAGGQFSNVDLGIQVTNDVAQYACGVRFYKNPSDTGTHTGAVWTSTGTLLASAPSSNETASGYQTILFSSGVPLSATTNYTFSEHSTTGFAEGDAQFQNTDYYGANMHVSGAYVSSNGNGSYGDSWPQDYQKNVAVGILGYADVTASATVAYAGNASVGTTYSGGNTMIGGYGPGPYMMIGNFVSAAGLPWHFDNGGGRWARRGDYTILRNYHYGPRYTFYGTPRSNGLDYAWRQPLEWKGGNRIKVAGDIFDGSLFEGGSKAMIALQSPGEVTCITDADIMYNTFKHGPGTLGGGLEYGSAPMGCPPVRTRYAHNISWDISSFYGVNANGTGWLLSGQIGAEDVIVDHNTDIGRSGGKPAWWDQAEFRIEGVQVTNNFLEIDPQFGGLEEDSSSFQTPDSCAGLLGKAMADCKWTPSYTMNFNVLSGVNGATKSQIQSFYPAPLVNYIPTDTSIAALGFFQAQNSYSLTTPDPNLTLKTLSSAYCGGCSSPAANYVDEGADMVQQIPAAQGVVIVSGYGPTGGNNGFVSVVQYDTYSCTLEYGADATFAAGTNTRTTQNCSPGTVVFNLTGLPSKSVVHWKFYGAVQEPQGQFRVN